MWRSKDFQGCKTIVRCCFLLLDLPRNVYWVFLDLYFSVRCWGYLLFPIFCFILLNYRCTRSQLEQCLMARVTRLFVIGLLYCIGLWEWKLEYTSVSAELRLTEVRILLSLSRLSFAMRKLKDLFCISFVVYFRIQWFCNLFWTNLCVCWSWTHKIYHPNTAWRYVDSKLYFE